MANEKNQPGGLLASRYLRGTSFLALEHAFYLALVTLLPTLLIGAAYNAYALWMTPKTSLTSYLSPMQMFDAAHAVWFAAALLALVPAMWVLYMRTHAEMRKRPGFTLRLAYKAPIYASLAVLTIFSVLLKIMLLSTVLYSIVAIGTSVDIGSLYMYQFLPGLLALAVVVTVGLYVFRLAQGADRSRRFTLLSLATAVVLALVLIISAAANLHSKIDSGGNEVMPLPGEYRSLDDYLKRY